MIPEASPKRARLEVKTASDFDAILGSIFDAISDAPEVHFSGFVCNCTHIRGVARLRNLMSLGEFGAAKWVPKSTRIE